MFSPTRLARCKPTFSLDGKPVSLGGMFHEAWLDLASRGRFVVVEAMAAHLCTQRPGTHVVVSLACTYSGREHARPASALVLVTSREPNDSLYRELVGTEEDPQQLRIERIGDCRQPALIAHAVYAGHKAAREMGAAVTTPPARDRAIV